MGELALNVAVSNAAKEYAVKKPKEAPKPEEEAVDGSQGARQSGLKWIESEKSEVNLSDKITDSAYLLSTSITDTSARISHSNQGPLRELRNKFKKMFISAYSNMFSHNRLLAKVSEWMVGNVMERLALVGMSSEELEGIKSGVRDELIENNQAAIAQVVYDETMLEIVA